MKLTVGGVPYEITELTLGENLDLITTTVPDNAVSGDLMVTIGSDSILWPLPIRIITLPVEAFVNTNQHLEEQHRTPANRPIPYFEIGTRFKPLVDGNVVGVTLRVPKDGNYTVTLWDNSTMEALHTEPITIKDAAIEIALFSDPVPLEGSREYTISFNTGYWYQHIDEQDNLANQFPQSFDSALELLSTAYYPGSSKVFPGEGFPVNYITKGADIIFAAGVE